MKTHRQILVFILSSLLLVNISYVGANTVDPLEQSRTDARIRGVANFLLERANANYFYLLETRIRDNDHLRCYFPNTYDYAASGDLKALLRSNGDIWKKSVEKDIEFIAVQALARYLADKGLEEYLKLMSKLQIKVKDKTYPLNTNLVTTGANVDPNAREVNKIVNEFFEFSDTLLKIRSHNTSNHTDCAYYTSLPEPDSRTKRYDASSLINDITTDLERLEGTFRKYKDRLVFKDQDKLEKKIKDHKLLVGLTLAVVAPDKITEKFEQELDRYKRFIKFVKSRTAQIAKEDVYLLKVRLVEDILKYRDRETGQPVLNIDTDTAEYRRFRKYMIFFAEVADARDEEKVKALLSEITLPAVSFGIKRTPGEDSLMITSYLGIAAGGERSADGDKAYGGMFAPVGLEWTFKRWDKRSLSLMIAPFDFAHPLNLEIEGKQDPVKLNDVVVPGVYLSYGFRDTPLTAGIGYSKGRAIRTDAEEEERIMLFFAFDMPLFSFH